MIQEDNASKSTVQQHQMFMYMQRRLDATVRQVKGPEKIATKTRQVSKVLQKGIIFPFNQTEPTHFSICNNNIEQFKSLLALLVQEILSFNKHMFQQQ